MRLNKNGYFTCIDFYNNTANQRKGKKVKEKKIFVAITHHGFVTTESKNNEKYKMN